MNTSSAHIGFRPLLHAPPERMSPGSDADIARRLVRSFDRAVAEPSEGAMNALHEDTIALAVAIRASVQEPERAVILLKAILRGHGGAGWAPSIAAGREAAVIHPESPVYCALFAWWVRAYYGEASPGLAPRPTVRQGVPA